MRKHKSAVTALLMMLMVWGGVAGSPLYAQDAPVAELLRQLSEAENARAADRLERQVRQEWSKSGSAAVDLLLKRGQDALEIGDLAAAREHLTAVTDHAPQFAEGWHGLAIAYFQSELFGPAADALERALALNPDHFGALRGLGAIFEQVNKPRLAYDAYSKVLVLRPHDSDVIEAIKRLEPQINGQTL